MAVLVPFFFFFFVNNVFIDLGTKSCMQLALWHIKNLNSKNQQRKEQNSNKACKTLQAGSSEPCRIANDD